MVEGFNVNCIKIYSTILSVTCHSLRNFAPLIHIPTNPFVNFQNPMSNYCPPSFEYKNNCYYYSFIIIVLYSQLYEKINTRCSLYKNLLQKKKAFSNIIQNAVENNLSEENTEHLICDRSNYSVKIFTAHPSPT